ncbi:Methyltransferase type 11 [Akanthomyces lecanii RCEF 1005]|uniref:Methyltransferase type 11 n=1 Tax=Akanthomyces lecanii RCEF 1005 TaxID=1081108 RepID=A0A167W1L3_CORDF|nr:Methyltransferase type 11 [Akanthomyces lecanii RCEF 1005]
MAGHKLQVTGIDVMDHHLDKARQNVARSGSLKDYIRVERMDFHHLERLKRESFDGVYTMETLAHATDAEQALKSFHQILRPGGRIVLHEYEHDHISKTTIAPDVLRAMAQLTQYAAVPTWGKASRGYFKDSLLRVGFEDVQIKDYSDNVRPMLRLFWLMAIIPNFFVQLFGLQAHFSNTIAGAYAYKGQKHWRYISISATKPEE